VYTAVYGVWHLNAANIQKDDDINVKTTTTAIDHTYKHYRITCVVEAECVLWIWLSVATQLMYVQAQLFTHTVPQRTMEINCRSPKDT